MCTYAFFGQSGIGGWGVGYIVSLIHRNKRYSELDRWGLDNGYTVIMKPYLLKLASFTQLFEWPSVNN